MMSDFNDSAYPRTCEYLAKIGIAPRYVALDGIDATGYDEFRHDGKGNIFRQERVRREWPSDLIGASVMKLMERDTSPKIEPVSVSYFDRTQGIVAQAVAKERARQDEKWGDQSGSYDGTGPKMLHLEAVPKRYELYAAEISDIFKMETDFRAENRVNGADMSDILLEEVFEALAEDNAEALYEELIQVAAVASAWCEYLLKRGANPRPTVRAVIAA